jgi:hypothetical protein
MKKPPALVVAGSVAVRRTTYRSFTTKRDARFELALTVQDDAEAPGEQARVGNA